MKTIGVIQARMGSSRLPYKMMLSLHGTPVIGWVVKRAIKAKLLDDIIVALPNTKENDIIESYLETNKIKCYRGSENDVLKRIYNAAKQEKASYVVRICADNPLISPVEIDNLINFYRNNKCDYAYNHIPKNNNYPDGLGAEIISFDLLKEIENNAKKKIYREHCCMYIYENKDKYKILTFNPPRKNIAYPNLKFDLDTFDDYYTYLQKSLQLILKQKN